VPPVPRRYDSLRWVESPALKDGANQLPPLPGRLGQCVGFRERSERWARLARFDVALSALCSGLFGDLGFSLPLVAPPQARV